MTGNNLLTHSSMSCAKTCMRRFAFAYEHGVRRDRTSQPLRMGSAFHAGLDELAGGKDIDTAIKDATRDYLIVPSWILTPDDYADWKAEAAIVAEMIRGYAWRWADAGCEIIATEQSFDLPLVNPSTGRESKRFRIAGKIDKIAKLPDGRLAIIEHKTTGDNIDADSDYWLRLRIDQQISMYYLAARRLGYDVETVLYDVAKKPGIRPRKLTKSEVNTLAETGKYFDRLIVNANTERETAEMYAARLADELAGEPEKYFARVEIPRLQCDLDEFAGELWQMAAIIADARKHGRYPRNTAACLHPYKCEYWQLCTEGYLPGGNLPDGFVTIRDVHPELMERK